MTCETTDSVCAAPFDLGVCVETPRDSDGWRLWSLDCFAGYEEAARRAMGFGEEWIEDVDQYLAVIDRAHDLRDAREANVCRRSP